MDDLTDMAVFAGVVEAHGFSGAARQLGLSKAVVSKRVARLEQRLGARLLYRTTRRLSVTESGTTYYEYCARVVAEAAEAEDAVTQLQTEPRGTLKVNAPMSFGRMHLASAIVAFLQHYPEVRVDMVMNDARLDLVAEGFDVAIRIAELPDSSLVARRLAPCRIAVCAAPAYLKRHGQPCTPADLRWHNCLLYTYSGPYGEWRFRGVRNGESVRVSGNLRANNGETLREAAVAGLGIIHSPTFLVGEDLKAGRLKRVLPRYALPELSIHALYAQRRHLPAKVRVFIEFLAVRFGPEPTWDAP
mgnify:CR=1 FL=1